MYKYLKSHIEFHVGYNLGGKWDRWCHMFDSCCYDAVFESTVASFVFANTVAAKPQAAMPKMSTWTRVRYYVFINSREVPLVLQVQPMYFITTRTFDKERMIQNSNRNNDEKTLQRLALERYYFKWNQTVTWIANSRSISNFYNNFDLEISWWNYNVL